MDETIGDKFAGGIFWELYIDLERQFQDFLDYVPYVSENDKTYSFKLLNLIQGIGGHINSAFIEMARYQRFTENDLCKGILLSARRGEGIIDWAVGAFDRIYGICRKKVRFKRLIEREDVMPFKTGNGIHPEWWNFYNSLKHDLGFNIEKATLKNARDALAGAFMLNVCHIPGSMRLCKYDVLRFGSGIDPDSSGRQDRLPCHVWQEILDKKQPYPAYVETPIFIYSYDQP